MAPSKPSLKSVKPPLPCPRAADDLAAARRVLTYASEALSGLATALDGEFSRAITLLMAAKGRVIVSGMGKSGHIARKIAATLSSTGTPAYFVHPTEASHGDLGAITSQDVLLVLSWGGETAELSDLITYAKRFRIPLIGIASNRESTLAKAADVTLVLPEAREACPMGLAPTTSTTMMLSLGDAIAVTLMERKNFSADQYRDFHPGGSLGRALIRVGDLMHQGTEIPLAREDASMREVLLTMASGRLGCVGIVDAAGGLAGHRHRRRCAPPCRQGCGKPQGGRGDDARAADRPPRTACRRGAGPDDRKEDHTAFRARVRRGRGQAAWRHPYP